MNWPGSRDPPAGRVHREGRQMSSVNLISGGIDVQSLVEQLIYVEGANIRSMQSQASKFQTRVTAFQTVNTRLSTLLTKVNTVLFGADTVPLTTPWTYEDRLDSSAFASVSANSSDEDLISVTGGKGTASGSFAVSVSALAKAQTSASGNFADTTSAFQTGTLSIQVGTEDPVVVTIDSSNNTLDGIRRAINSADVGVTATVINDGSATTPYRLLLSADESGTANAFTVTPSLSGTGQSISFAVTNTAVDARLRVNGIDITKSSNAVSDVIDGVTMNLKALTTSDVTVNASPDLDSIVTAIKGLASAYNDANTYISAQYRYDSTTKTAGTLSGDATLRAVQSKVQAVFTQSVANSFTSYGVLSQVGVEFNRDGSLTINESDLRDALTDNPGHVAALFLGDGTPPDGVNAGVEGSSPLVNLRSILKSITDPLSGPIHHATDGLNNTIKDINSQIASYQERLDIREELLTKEFSKADEALKLMSVNQSSLSSLLGSLQ
jgi:flagellar hook-associated protein 2